jgi:putative membrane protein
MAISSVGIFLRGAAMGTADLVPGVSGGTVALITGIYPRLLAAVTAADAAAVRLLLKGQWLGLWRHVDGAFLLPLMLGIGSAIFALASTLKLLLETQPLLVWSFFCGLVLLSSLALIRTEMTKLTPMVGLMFLIGVVIMLTLGLGTGISFPQHLGGFFVAGLLGICAMILPGISGSFILLLLGMYGPIITAVADRELLPLLVFAVGCAVGLLTFSRFLTFVLARARVATLALLVGFLLGSLVILWPWQQVLQTTIDPEGQARPIQTVPITPAHYQTISGDSQWLGCLLSALLGAGVVISLQGLAGRSANVRDVDAP